MKPKNFPGRKNLRKHGKGSEYDCPPITDIRFRFGSKCRRGDGLPKVREGK
jgi:hypothetical protein